ncbi:putative granule-associated protein [gamma proteobacterium IMCC2047]|nr:putative granule-associated protein [gamma proteobacterium IMCC2047]
MFEKMTEQFENTMKPVNSMFATNAKVLEQLAQQQTKLFSDVLNDSIAYTETLGAQKDVIGMFEAQKSFVESVQVKMVNATKDAQNLFADVQEKTGATVKEFFENGQKAAATATKATK